MMYMSNYWQLYQPHSLVRIFDITAIPNGIRVSIECPHGKDGVRVEDLVFAGDTTETRRVEFCDAAAEWFIEAQMTPQQHYADAGQTSPGWITITDTNIPYSFGPDPYEWAPVMKPEDVERANRLFGVFTSDTYSDLTNASKIAEAIYTNYTKRGGTPSDSTLASHPFDQYESDAQLWCSNVVDIFVLACRCFGIPARRINMWQGGVMPPDIVEKLGFNVQTAGGHTCAEMYGADWGSDRWVWIDPTLGIMGARIGDDAESDFPLVSFLDVVHHINSPEYKNLLKFIHIEGDTWETGVLETLGCEKQLRNVMNPTQRYNFEEPPCR